MRWRKERNMTLIAARQVPARQPVGLRRPAAVNHPVRDGRRPGPARPAGTPLRYRGTGVVVSQAVHRRRPVSSAVTVALAGVAALITIWLGAIAQLSGVGGSSAPVPGQLAVVQVQPGETLQHLAARVAPDAPIGRVVERIRELNELDSAALDAGQTLIAPVS